MGWILLAVFIGITWLVGSQLGKHSTTSSIVSYSVGLLVATLTSPFIVISIQNSKAWFNGFDNQEQYQSAKKVGIDNPEDYAKHLQDKEALRLKRMAEAEAAASHQRMLEAAKKEREKAERKHQLAQREANCRTDLSCFGERNMGDAVYVCKKGVEKQAKYDFQWLDEGIFNPTFSSMRWKNQSDGIVTYIGSKLKLQNGFGAWQYYTYYCDFDTQNDRVTGIRLVEGQR